MLRCLSAEGGAQGAVLLQLQRGLQGWRGRAGMRPIFRGVSGKTLLRLKERRARVLAASTVSSCHPAGRSTRSSEQCRQARTAGRRHNAPAAGARQRRPPPPPPPLPPGAALSLTRACRWPLAAGAAGRQGGRRGQAQLRAGRGQQLCCQPALARLLCLRMLTAPMHHTPRSLLWSDKQFSCRGAAPVPAGSFLSASRIRSAGRPPAPRPPPARQREQVG